jgi:soluble lytic murein transglycosylase-like protein
MVEVRRRLGAAMVITLALLTVSASSKSDAAGPVTIPASQHAATSSAIDEWTPLIAEASNKFGVPVAWIRAVMRVESGGQTMLSGVPITSPAGAMGLMQVMPDTYAEMQNRYGLGPDPYNPQDNILAGTAYLREMYLRYGYPDLFAAYNAGPARFDAFLYDDASLPEETAAYLEKLGQLELGASGLLASPIDDVLNGFAWHPDQASPVAITGILGTSDAGGFTPSSQGLFVQLRTEPNRAR